MLGKVFGILCLIACLCGLLTGNAQNLGSAVLDGAASAVELTLSLSGMMCFWCGIMRVLTEAGIIRRLSRLMLPFLRLVFPNAAKRGEGLEEISANISANLLGIGNAATPFALAAMQKMQLCNPKSDTASDEQITLAVLNTAGLTLLPANLLALRRAAGSAQPYAILLPVWIASLCSCTMALLLCSIPRMVRSLKGKS